MGYPNKAAAAAGVDVVIPVFGAAEELAECLRSVAAHTAMPPHGLILVLDGPQPKAVEQLLEDPELTTATILRLPQRRGFVQAVNRGMSASERDVVLLNSDTVVTAGWLERLAAAAHSAPDIATVSPFSNNATICSFPDFLTDNELPAGCSVEAVGRAIAASSRRVYPELPTGVGVCLYIRRGVLDHIGLFDADTFGLGYGEEGDFCRRAVAAGRRNILDDATFVFHHGRRSFGPEGRHREVRGERTLRRRHPDYYRAVARFIHDDPLAPLRRRAVRALPTTPPRTAPAKLRVCHLVHGWPPFNHAGTEVYARQLATAQATDLEVSAYLRVADPGRPTGAARSLLDHGVRTRLVVNNFDRRDPLARNAVMDLSLMADFTRFIEGERPQILHVHHLAGHCATLMGVAAARGVRLLYQAQDWWPICARANLCDHRNRPCAGPSAGRCSRCLPLTGLPGAALWNRLLHVARRQILRRQLALAHAYVMGSEALRRDFDEAGLFAPGAPVHVVPYGVEHLATNGVQERVRFPEAPLRCAVIGSVMPHKGVHVALEALRRLPRDRVRLEIWGHPAADPEYRHTVQELAAETGAILCGPFADADKASIFAATDLLLVPSIGRESFGIAPREAMAAGVPVVASDHSALAELPLAGPCGALVPTGDAAALAAVLQELLETPSLLDDWRRRLPRPKTLAEHGSEIRAVYERLMSS